MIEDRSIGLGGSDAAAALGFDKYCSPYQLWLEKTGRADPKSTGLAAEVGTYLEPFVAQKYEQIKNVKVRTAEGTLYHPKYSFLYAHLDRLVKTSEELADDIIIECKTSGAFRQYEWGEEDTGKLPPPYLLQVYYYLALTNFKQADVAVLIGNHDFKIYRIPPNQELQQTIIDGMVNFWEEYVLKDIAPSPKTWFDLKHRYQDIKKNLREASAGEVEMIKEYNSLNTAIKKQQKHIDHIKWKLCNGIGENSGLSTADGKTLVTWKEMKIKAPTCPHCHLPLYDKPELPQRRFWVCKAAKGL